MPVRRPQFLTPEQEAAVRAALMAGATRCEAAAAIGITRQFLDTRLRDQLRDLRVGQGRRGAKAAEPREPDPDEDEIKFRAAMIRRAWTAERWLPASVDEPEKNF
jgi:hypothetical protein